MSGAAYNQASKQNPRPYRAKKREELKKNSQTVYSRAARAIAHARPQDSRRGGVVRLAGRCAARRRRAAVFAPTASAPRTCGSNCYSAADYLRDKIASPGQASESEWDNINQSVGNLADKILAQLC